MKVYCPCKRNCSGYTGTTRRCTKIGSSSTMPQQFVEARAKRRGSFLGSVASAMFDSLTPAAAERSGTRVSYETWECPACKCEVLVVITKTGTETKSSQMDSIPTC